MKEIKRKIVRERQRQRESEREKLWGVSEREIERKIKKKEGGQSK